MSQKLTSPQVVPSFNTFLQLSHWKFTGWIESFTCSREIKLGQSGLQGNIDAWRDNIIGKNKSKTLIIHRKSQSRVSWAVILAYGSRSRRGTLLDRFPSIPDLTLLDVELLAFYRVSQNLHLLTRSEARTIHTSKNHSLGHGQNHGKKVN